MNRVGHRAAEIGVIFVIRGFGQERERFLDVVLGGVARRKEGEYLVDGLAVSHIGRAGGGG